jgi:hypothetical protein
MAPECSRIRAHAASALAGSPGAFAAIGRAQARSDGSGITAERSSGGGALARLVET